MSKGGEYERSVNRSASKGDNKDNAVSWDKHDFDVEGREGAE